MINRSIQFSQAQACSPCRRFIDAVPVKLELCNSRLFQKKPILSKKVIFEKIFTRFLLNLCFHKYVSNLPRIKFKPFLDELTFKKTNRLTDWSTFSGSAKEKSPTSWTGRSGLPSASPSCPTRTPASTWRPLCLSFKSRCRRSRERGHCLGWPRPSQPRWPKWPPCFNGR